jgi:drug/metabolite transporter (DMT)-like permease
LIILSVAWGGSFFFAEIVLRELEPLTIVYGRVSLAVIALVAYVYFSGNRMPTDCNSCLQFLVMGTLNNTISFTLIVWGQSNIDSGLASIINAMTPVSAVVLAHLLTNDERLSTNTIFGVIFGVLGVAGLIEPDALVDLDGQTWGKIAILGAGISYSLA